MTHRDNAMPEIVKFLSKQPVGPRDILELGPYNDIQFRTLFEQHGMMYRSIDPFVCNGENCYIGKMENLPFPNQQFDMVFACHAFEHTERPVDTLREALRVLKPGGYLFFITPLHCEHHVLRADADHINVVTEMQMQRFLTYTGFTGINVYRSSLADKLQDDNIISIAQRPQ